jgi:hypothetical protein
LTASASDPLHPLQRLDPEDLEFVLRFVLASGSLKEVAARYGVSYPTIRARLDRLIARLQALSSSRKPDPMADLLADFVGQGQIGSVAAKQILKLHRESLKPSGDDLL